MLIGLPVPFRIASRTRKVARSARRRGPTARSAARKSAPARSGWVGPVPFGAVRCRSVRSGAGTGWGGRPRFSFAPVDNYTRRQSLIRRHAAPYGSAIGGGRRSREPRAAVACADCRCACGHARAALPVRTRRSVVASRALRRAEERRGASPAMDGASPAVRGADHATRGADRAMRRASHGRRGADHATETRRPWQTTRRPRHGTRLRWQTRRRPCHRTCLPWQTRRRPRQPRRRPWQATRRPRQRRRRPWQTRRRPRHGTRLPWQTTRRPCHRTRLPWQTRRRSRHGRRRPWQTRRRPWHGRASLRPRRLPRHGTDPAEKSTGLKCSIGRLPCPLASHGARQRPSRRPPAVGNRNV